MTVKKAIAEIDNSNRIINELESKLSVLGADDMDEHIEITTSMAYALIDICQEYRDMLLGEEVEIKYDLPR